MARQNKQTNKAKFKRDKYDSVYEGMVITVQPIEFVYGDESSPGTRMYPVHAAEKVDDKLLWQPSRLHPKF